MTEIKKESADGAWLRSTLAELAGDAFPVYDLPSLQVDTNSSIQLSALADRQAAREMRQAASDVEARRLDAARVVEGLKTEAERLRGTIAAQEKRRDDAGTRSTLFTNRLGELREPEVLLARAKTRFNDASDALARVQSRSEQVHGRNAAAESAMKSATLALQHAQDASTRADLIDQQGRMRVGRDSCKKQPFAA